VVHHAVIDIAHDLTMTQATTLLCHPEIARVNELDELRRLVIEPDG